MVKRCMLAGSESENDPDGGLPPEAAFVLALLMLVFGCWLIFSLGEGAPQTIGGEQRVECICEADAGASL